MDAKVTLHFDREVIEQAKVFAANHNISLSRLTEFLYRQITTGNYQTLEKFPIADWVMQVAEGEATYRQRSHRKLKQEYQFNCRYSFGEYPTCCLNTRLKCCGYLKPNS